MPCSHLPPTDHPDPLRVEDAHLTETVLLLARGIAADNAFDRLPILADALEDAGCDNFALLTHLRSDEPHRVECWALRRLLRTTLLLPGGVPMVFAYCPPGTFEMGSNHREADEGEQPVRRVTLSRGFMAGVYPVTQEQWWVVMGTDPSEFKGGHRPVERVSWDDATAFCARASLKTGRLLRLPTEAEWEYACRAGTSTEYHWGDEWEADRMNHDFGGHTLSELSGGTSAAGHYPPNSWGLLDMHGNVAEWCEDLSNRKNLNYALLLTVDPICDSGESSHRVIRGGSWRDDPVCCRSACRYHGQVGERFNDQGFRVVFTVG